MSEEELEKTIYEMETMLGMLPNPECEPRRFAAYVKLFKYLKSVDTSVL